MVHKYLSILSWKKIYIYVLESVLNYAQLIINLHRLWCTVIKLFFLAFFVQTQTTFRRASKPLVPHCYATLRKPYLHFLSYWMGYDRGDCFSFDFEPNGNPFGSKSKGNLSSLSYPIQLERNWKYGFLSVHLGALVAYL